MPDASDRRQRGDCMRVMSGSLFDDLLSDLSKKDIMLIKLKASILKRIQKIRFKIKKRHFRN